MLEEGEGSRCEAASEVVEFERGLCPRNRFMGEASEGAVEAPSEKTLQMGPYRCSSPVILIPEFFSL